MKKKQPNPSVQTIEINVAAIANEQIDDTVAEAVQNHIANRVENIFGNKEHAALIDKAIKQSLARVLRSSELRNKMDRKILSEAHRYLLDNVDDFVDQSSEVLSEFVGDIVSRQIKSAAPRRHGSLHA